MVVEHNETKKNERNLTDARQIWRLWTTSLYITMPKFEVHGRQSPFFFLVKNTQNALIH